MVIFPPLRTRRIDVQLREISTREAIKICKLPATRLEVTTTELLKAVARDAKASNPRYVSNPRLWTVEERARLVVHYLSQVSEDGADFFVGGPPSKARLSDYLMVDRDLNKVEAPMGKVAGKDRVLRPLLGAHVEVLELRCHNRGEWLLGVLGCQVFEAGEAVPDYAHMSEIDLMEWCAMRVKAVEELAESDFEDMYEAWNRIKHELAHFFVVGVDNDGVVFQRLEEGEVGSNHPARFRSLSCVSETTRILFA